MSAADQPEHPSPGDPRELLAHGYGYALALTHDAAQAETLLYDAWITVLRAGGPWERLYLYPAIRHIYEVHAGGEALAEAEAISEHDVFAADALDVAVGDDEPLEGGEATVAQALGALRSGEREGLYLIAVDGCSVDEVAELTGRTRGTVLTVLSGAFRSVRAACHDARKGPA